jgi:hypothetical protein
MCRVRDVPVQPVYDIGEHSDLRIWRVAPLILRLLIFGFVERLVQRFVVRDTHPLVLFYLVGGLLLIPGLVFGTYLFVYRILVGPVAAVSALFATFVVLTGLNFLMFALWFDMDANRELR